MSTKQIRQDAAVRVRTSAPGLLARYMIGILLCTIGTAGILSLVGSGGSYVMTEIRKYLNGIAGIGPLSAPLPLLLIWLGAALIVSCYHRVTFRAPVLAMLLYICVLGVVTTATHVTNQNNQYLMDYIPQLNAQRYSASAYSSRSLTGYGQRLFNWGYSGNLLGAGGALSLAVAYPAYQLFGSVGGIVIEVVLAVACLIALLGIRPTAVIRGLSDFFEKQRLDRDQRQPERQPKPAAPQPAVSPIPDQPRNGYTNPYTNVRWIYDEGQPEEAESPAAAPQQPWADPAPAFRPEEPADSPFVPVNTGGQLYQEPFVLHPDGAYDVYEEPAGTEEPDPSRFVRPGSGKDAQPPVREPAAPVWTAPAAPQKPVEPAKEAEPWAAPVTEPVEKKPEAEPLKAEAQVPEQVSGLQRPADPDPVTPAETAAPEREEAPDDTLPWEEPKDADGELTAIGRRIRDAQRGLDQLRGKKQSAGRAEVVHTDPVAMPPIEHVPIQPAAPAPKTADTLDDRPKMPEPAVPKVQNGPYTPPPMSFLGMPKAVDPSDSALEDQRRAQQIERTLKTFNIESQVREITHGPAITRFALKIAEGVKVKQVSGVLDNIMLEMGSDLIRIETPIPGTSYIGIEVPNSKVGSVTLREVLDSREMREAASPLAVALGKDIAGKPIIGDLAKMPHLLIAGATGSGKSVCINSIICSLLYRVTPKQVRLIMVDPKQVELQVYNGIPHLLVPVVSDPKKAAAALEWAVQEMMERYHTFSQVSVRNLEGYNAKMTDPDKKLPSIVIIIDEMADLMDVCRKEVEESIRRLAALARAAGVYMVLATQRPSVDVITGVIKNNIPSRIAFTVSSGTDSRTILDTYGAEKLMGRGDMLYMPVGISKPRRVQGCFVSDEEVTRITDNIRARYHAEYNDSMQTVIEQPPVESDASEEPAPDAPGDLREKEESDLLNEAIRIAVHDGQTSISMLQRTLRIGYARAGRIIDEMTKRGIISDSEGTKPRKTIISREEYVQMMSDGLLGDSDGASS